METVNPLIAEPLPELVANAPAADLVTPPADMLVPRADMLLPRADMPSMNLLDVETPLVNVEMPLLQANMPLSDSLPAPAMTASGALDLEFDRDLLEMAKRLPDIGPIYPNDKNDPDLRRDVDIDVDKIIERITALNTPEPGDGESTPDIRPRAHLSPDLFDAGMREDAEAARRARFKTDRDRDVNESWTVGIRSFRSASTARFNPGEGIFSGRPYDAGSWKGARALGRRMPPSKWMRSFNDRSKCRRCGSKREGNKCTSCGTEFCESCNCTLEDGRCGNSQCDRWESDKREGGEFGGEAFSE